MQTMEQVQRCYTTEAASDGSSGRHAMLMLLLVVACLGALAIAALLFWQPQATRGIAIPIAVSVALLSAVAATLAQDDPGDGQVAARSRLRQAKWHWAVRITRSNQMPDDAKAIDEAIAATNEFVNVATAGR